MKTFTGLSLGIFLLAITSCYIDNMESVYGDGNVVSDERMIGDFDGLKVSSGIDVVMRQGDKVSLLLEADENLHEVIKTEIINNTLKIHTSKNIRKAKTKKVFLIYKELNSIKVSSAGDVKGENTLRTGILTIDLSSAGDLELDIEAEEVDCNISSSGDARLSGSTDLLKVNLSSAGDLYAFDLKSEKCRVNCSSAGDARVYASDEFDLRSSSAGSIYYKGDGKLTNSNSSSGGSIVRK